MFKQKNDYVEKLFLIRSVEYIIILIKYFDMYLLVCELCSVSSWTNFIFLAYKKFVKKIKFWKLIEWIIGNLKNTSNAIVFS